MQRHKFTLYTLSPHASISAQSSTKSSHFNSIRSSTSPLFLIRNSTNFRLTNPILTVFYKCFIKSILTFDINVWFRSLTFTHLSFFLTIESVTRSVPHMSYTTTSTPRLLIKNATSESSKFLAALEGFMAFKSSELTHVPERSWVITVPACDYYPL